MPTSASVSWICEAHRIEIDCSCRSGTGGECEVKCRREVTSKECDIYVTVGPRFRPASPVSASVLTLF